MSLEPAPRDGTHRKPKFLSDGVAALVATDGLAVIPFTISQ